MTDRISLAELDELLRRGEQVVILDARKDDVYQASATMAAGAIRAVTITSPAPTPTRTS